MTRTLTYSDSYFLFLLFSFCIFNNTSLEAQRNLPTSPILEQQVNPNKEIQLLKSNTEGIPVPPTSEVRAMAEWEELQAIAIAWSSTWADDRPDYDTLLAEITFHARQECNVNILCDDVAAIQQRLADIVNITDFTLPIICPGGVPGTSSINFIPIEGGEFDGRIWIRDYGAHTIYTNDVDTLAFVDWKYDDNFPQADVYPSSTVADFYNTLLYVTTEDEYAFRLDGGNFLTDGMGSAFSSRIVIGENNELGSPAQIVDEFMGINTYHYQGLPVLLHHAGARKHVDMYMKLLDEETVLLGEGYPEDNINADRISEYISYFGNLPTPFERDYQIKRIIVPPDENGDYPGDANAQGGCNVIGSSCFTNYTNALFVNRTILVPTYQNDYDAIALETWQNLMPGYNIVGINSSEIIRRNGAIHCVTKEIGVNEPLWITHPKIREACISDSQYNIFAQIQHVSGIASAKVFYTTNPIKGFHFVEMEAIDETTFEAVIPQYHEGATIHYYIQAVANDGKKMFRPMPAPTAYWSFDVVACSPNAQHNITNSPYGITNIFPNPAQNLAYVSLDIPNTTYLNLEVLDIWGRVVQVLYEGKSQEGKQDIEVSLEAMPSGVYILSMNMENFKQKKKFVKQ